MSGNHAGERMVVVPYNPGEAIKKRLFSWIAVLLTALVFTVLGFYYSDIKTLQLKERNQALQEQLDTANQRVTEVAHKLIALEQEKAIDAVAKNQSQETLRELQASVQKLTRDLAFYKGIMSPAAGVSGLQISQLDIRKERTPGRFQFKLVLAQIMDQASIIEGVTELNLIGLKDGKKVSLPVNGAAGESSIKFKFRYFQDIEGEIVLPDGFVPEQIQVIAQAKGKKSTKIERTFNWETGA